MFDVNLGEVGLDLCFAVVVNGFELQLADVAGIKSDFRSAFKLHPPFFPAEALKVKLFLLRLFFQQADEYCQHMQDIDLKERRL